MSDHDLRRQADEIRAALGRFEREQLVEILTHVYRQYVLEGTLPVALPAAPAGASDDLSGLSFAQLVERLQLRLDLPELQQFEVSGGRVSVRVEGRLVAIEPPGAPAQGRLGQVQVSLRPQGETPPQPQQAPAAPGVLAAPASAAAPTVVPAPPAPLPTGVGPVSRAVAPAPRPAAPPRPTAQPPAAQPAAAPDKERPADDAGGRFTLLEID